MRLTIASRTKWALIVALGLVALVGLNFLRVDRTAGLAAKYQNDVTVRAYYRFGILPDRIVFDLWHVGMAASQAEVLGIFLRFADAMKDRDFNEVRLAYRGRTRFVLDGTDFRTIGREFTYQNPVYTVRTFPEKLRRPDGRAAFKTWSGGMLGVLGQQMDDVNALGRQWYLDEMLSR